MHSEPRWISLREFRTHTIDSCSHRKGMRGIDWHSHTLPSQRCASSIYGLRTWDMRRSASPTFSADLILDLRIPRSFLCVPRYLPSTVLPSWFIGAYPSRWQIRVDSVVEGRRCNFSSQHDVCKWRPPITKSEIPARWLAGWRTSGCRAAAPDFLPLFLTAIGSLLHEMSLGQCCASGFKVRLRPTLASPRPSPSLTGPY